ncbi:hypothetical protein [Polynucleobacter sp. MWH-UH25E]|uniref:hypothetical protein n=1 Tax=Polynucleobacter sp. MWH-UH25E TaxID=1855616 RepID=UPI001BFE2B31|nr:hypothetical protein [Polynucleobacter sp. MWH-UH25E]QWD62362.1 hypothetical protein ICV39_01730 [Polynucleobacter sp. MWH-UH25E]
MKITEEIKVLSILLVGNSVKFHQIFLRAYPNANIQVISWRNCISEYAHVINSHKTFDIIVFCGYDYKSYIYNYKTYFRVNVEDPVKIASQFSKKSQLIYIDTAQSIAKNTMSRYVFAKKKLAQELYRISETGKLRIISLDTIIHDGAISINGGVIECMIFRWLATLGRIKLHSSEQIIDMAKKSSMHGLEGFPLCPSPYMLHFPRPRFADRLLRLIYG